MFKLGSFPLLIIPVVLYNIMAFFFMSAAPETPGTASTTTPAQSQTQAGSTDAPLTLEGAAPAAAVQTPEPASPSAGNPDPAESARLSESAAERITMTRFSPTLPTGGVWQISIGDLFVMLALGLLFFELVTSTRATSAVLVNHTFSLVLFVVCLVQFLLLPAFATSVFFIITLMTLLDVLAGFIVTAVAARRDISLSDQMH